TELVGRKGDGSPFPVEMQISETRSGEGRLFTACARDISDRKRAEGRLRLLSSVAQESLSGILILDLDEHIVFANPAFERLSGYRPETVMGTRIESFLFGPDTAYHSRRVLRDAFDSRTPARVEIIQYHSNGPPFWTEMHVAPVPDTRGRITHFVAL